ncbi:hypothetical protein [Sphingomonas sp. NIBR02145]|uniref:hypothetical protein n=1 Tax=Sphingomonas sp. NIBR02145 TaxID=3014784 RepID=UPI0022B5D1C4|nr:hypothetical protein [Sphingomonas sp. NIBR02145]WHU03543.1 hypothetical protein O3305_02750 [Sphingomonas sp. NIBR02145]
MRHALLLGSLLLTTAAVAAPTGPVNITTTVLAETRADAANGITQVKLVPARRVVPGDHVVYQIKVTNSGAKPASGVVIANPVPAGMQYAGPAANSPAPEVSVDGKSFGQLASLRIATADGRARPATAADVRVVRWRLAQPVPAGGAQQVAFRALLK